MNSEEKSIISQIGLVTLKFSQLEHLTLEYISVLLSGNVTLDNYMIFQNYTLEKKLQTLKDLIRLNHVGKYEKDQLDLIKRIGELKTTRNLFIHGDWQIPEINDIGNIKYISVRQNKYKFNVPNDGSADKQWLPNKYTRYTLNDFIEFEKAIDKLVNELKDSIRNNERTF